MKYFDVKFVEATFIKKAVKEGKLSLNFNSVAEACENMLSFMKKLAARGTVPMEVVETSMECESFGSHAVDEDYYVADVGFFVHPLAYCTVKGNKVDDRAGMQRDKRNALLVKELGLALKPVFAQICANGFDIEERKVKVLTYTASSIKKDRVICVPKEHMWKLNHALGIANTDFVGESFADMAKIQALAFAGQAPITSFGMPKWGMRNVLVLKSFFFKQKINNARQMETSGKILGFEEEAEYTQNVGDAQGVFIETHLPEELRRKKPTIQARGKGLKGMLTSGDVERWMKEADCPFLVDYWDRKWTIEDLEDNEIHVLVTEDMMKGDLWKESPMAWYQWCAAGNYYNELYACAYVDNDTRLENTIRCSRQHFTTLFGVDKEHVQGAAQMTINHCLDIKENGSELTRRIEKLVPGFRETVLGKVLDDAEYRPLQTEAHFGRLETDGCFAFVVWDMRPLIAASFAHANGERLSYEEVNNMRTLKGAVAAFGAKAAHKECVFGRYPSIAQAFVHSYLCKSQEICRNVIEASWDLPLGAVLKADTDGDHLSTYLKAKEA